MIIEVIAAFFVAYSFGILFNIKGKYLIIAGGGGAIGWFLYKFCMQIGIAETSSLFIASIGFSIYCDQAASHSQLEHPLESFVKLFQFLSLVVKNKSINDFIHFPSQNCI